jgi:hypothetical protein
MLICPDQLHLTRLNGLVQLRTQFHHLDASAQLEAVNRRREKEAQEGTKPAEPKAFLPTVKKSGGDTAAEMTQAFMKSANVETWDKLHYFDEDVCHQPLRLATETNYTDRHPRHTTPTAIVYSCLTLRTRPSFTRPSITTSSLTQSAPLPAAREARRSHRGALQTISLRYRMIRTRKRKRKSRASQS